MLAWLARGVTAWSLLSLKAAAEKSAVFEVLLFILKVALLVSAVWFDSIFSLLLAEFVVAATCGVSTFVWSSLAFVSATLLSLFSWFSWAEAVLSLSFFTASFLGSSVVLTASEAWFSFSLFLVLVFSSVVTDHVPAVVESVNSPSFLGTLKEATLLSWLSIVVSAVLVALFWSSETTWS